jgi:hypothetical protein
MMNYSFQQGGAEFTTADALTIALACVAVIVSFYALAKGCEKFLQKRKERMNDTLVTANYAQVPSKASTNAISVAGTVTNNSVTIAPGDKEVAVWQRWDQPIHEKMSGSDAKNALDKAVASVTGFFKEKFQVADSKSESQRNANFIMSGQGSERFTPNPAGGWCVGTGTPIGPDGNCNTERYSGKDTYTGNNPNNGPNGMPFTLERKFMEHMDGCSLGPNGKCLSREHMTEAEHSRWLLARGCGDVLTAEGSVCNPIFRNESSLAERFCTASAGDMIRTIDDVTYRMVPVTDTVLATPAGGKLSYLRLLPQDSEQALSAGLPIDTNDLNQAELTNTDAGNVDVGQLLLLFGPDEITRDNVALTGDDGFIVRELKYRKKPVVLTDGVNNYTISTLAEWANFKYNPMNSGATASMGLGTAAENAVESFINRGVMQQGTGNYSPYELYSTLGQGGLVTNARSRSGAKNF